MYIKHIVIKCRDRIETFPPNEHVLLVFVHITGLENISTPKDYQNTISGIMFNMKIAVCLFEIK